jgi:hypothetical protein
MKTAATIALLAVAFYFAIALPMHDRAKLQLEREKFELEQKEKKAKEETEEVKRRMQQQARDAAGTKNLDCLADNEAHFNSGLELNGTPIPGKKRSRHLSQTAVTRLHKEQNDNDEGCRRQYELDLKAIDAR